MTADRIIEQRLEKVARLRAAGVNPYPYKFRRTHTAKKAVALLDKVEAGMTTKTVASVAGRIMALRSMGKAAFVDIRDDSGKIQLLFVMAELPEELQKVFKDLDIGDFIGVTGNVIRTRTGEPSVRVVTFSLLTKSMRPLPEKWHGLVDVDTRHRQRYLDLISNVETLETFKLRSQIIRNVRAFLDKRGFWEVETPILEGAAGGATAKPFVTHHNALDQDFVLRIATELHLKRLIIGGFDRVYEIGRAFRNEGLSTKHNPEFTLMESYEAYSDYQEVMRMLERMVSQVALKVHGTQQVVFGGNVLDFKPPWRRITLRQAILDHSGIDYEKYPDADSLREVMREKGIEADSEKGWGGLVDDLLSEFAEPKMIQPTFLTEYPLAVSPLAKVSPKNPRVAERFEAFAGGLEFANAFSELNDPVDQRQRFVKQMEQRGAADAEESVDQDFLTAMEYGMPPTGGLGVGIDRLVMLLTNQTSIREVILFPQLKEK
jgi:lysyl-tRNA synthetase, class II